MTDPKIVPVEMLPLGMLNAFLVVENGRAMLVDTGLPRSASKVKAALERHGLTLSDLRLIVVTHAHIDHAGSAEQLRALSGAPILAHQDEVDYCAGKPPLLRPSGLFGRLFQKSGVIERRFEYFTPDHVMTEAETGLQDFGFDSQVLHTPGHTPGSLSVLLPDGNILAGDLAASGILLGGIALKNRPKSPPFEEAPKQTARSLERLLARGGKRFYLGHGGPLSAQRIRAHAAKLKWL
ncbi:MBL fold metallo-hydrolase [Thalassovita aquimarina]|uniref:MBL fold metallo-hydrolase n=1 Tax=Thalassovita aquimarina TaxID=2785917 RepID=UPI003566053E